MKKTFTLPDTTGDGQALSQLEGGKMLTVRLEISSDGIRMDGVEIIGWSPRELSTEAYPSESPPSSGIDYGQDYNRDSRLIPSL